MVEKPFKNILSRKDLQLFVQSPLTEIAPPRTSVWIGGFSCMKLHCLPLKTLSLTRMACLLKEQFIDKFKI